MSRTFVLAGSQYQYQTWCDTRGIHPGDTRSVLPVWHANELRGWELHPGDQSAFLEGWSNRLTSDQALAVLAQVRMMEALRHDPDPTMPTLDPPGPRPDG